MADELEELWQQIITGDLSGESTKGLRSSLRATKRRISAARAVLKNSKSTPVRRSFAQKALHKGEEWKAKLEAELKTRK